MNVITGVAVDGVCIMMQRCRTCYGFANVIGLSVFEREADVIHCYSLDVDWALFIVCYASVLQRNSIHHP